VGLSGAFVVVGIVLAVVIGWQLGNWLNRRYDRTYNS
jgi:uncharacterized protein YneF (UPF0154 family)